MESVLTAAAAGLLGGLGGLVVHQLLGWLWRRLPGLAAALGVLSTAAVCLGSVVGLMALGSPYMGEVHGDVTQLLVTVWVTVAVLAPVHRVGGSSGWVGTGRAATAAAATAGLLLLVSDFDLGWEPAVRKLLSVCFAAGAVLCLLVLDRRLRPAHHGRKPAG